MIQVIALAAAHVVNRKGAIVVYHIISGCHFLHTLERKVSKDTVDKGKFGAKNTAQQRCLQCVDVGCLLVRALKLVDCMGTM